MVLSLQTHATTAIKLNRRDEADPFPIGTSTDYTKLV